MCTRTGGDTAVCTRTGGDTAVCTRTGGDTAVDELSNFDQPGSQNEIPWQFDLL